MSLITRRTHVITLAFALAAAACAEGPEVDNAFEEPALDVGKGDGVDYDNWTFFEMEGPDFRRCMFPMCGGMYVSRTNQTKVKCGPGDWQKSCYVAQYDFSALTDNTEEQAQLMQDARADLLVVRGEIKRGFFPDFPEIAVLSVTEAWKAANTNVAKGVFYRAHDLGIMCITAPCVSVELTRLNRNADPIKRVAGVDLTKVLLDEGQLNKVWQSMRDGAVLVSGSLKKVTGLGGSAQQMSATQVFSRFVSNDVLGQVCGGRSGACPDGYFCQFPSAICDHADGTGECQVKPTMCDKIYAPVCGCDGATYDNDCMRQMMGGGFGSPGECKVAIGCQIGGCGGEVCTNAGAEPPVSICIARPTDHCYQDHGVCEPQANGCGWSMSPELEGCLAGVEQR